MNAVIRPNVTSNDISRGLRHDMFACAIARAANRKLRKLIKGAYCEVCPSHMDPQFTVFGKDGSVVGCGFMTEKTNQFGLDFDNAFVLVAPTTLEIDLELWGDFPVGKES